jgi:hypothetical protein
MHFTHKQQPEPADVWVHAKCGEAVTMFNLSPPWEAVPVTYCDMAPEGPQQWSQTSNARQRLSNQVSAAERASLPR